MTRARTHTHTHTHTGNGAIFGFSVSVSGDNIAVGDPADNFEWRRNQVGSCDIYVYTYIRIVIRVPPWWASLAM